MKAPRNQTEPGKMLETTIPLIEAQIISITVISPVIGMALNAALWSTIVGVSFAVAMISAVRQRIPQLIEARVQRVSPAVQSDRNLAAHAV
jgi:hypothetical protein